MAEDRKPPQHRDYGMIVPKTSSQTGLKRISVSEGVPTLSDPDRDGTPPPMPGTITNEDLAVKIREVDKKTDEQHATTTQRLTFVEDEVHDVGRKVGSLDVKVDKVLAAIIERQTITHASHTVIDQVERTAQIENKKDAAAFKRRLTLEGLSFTAKVALAVLASLGTGTIGALIHKYL